MQKAQFEAQGVKRYGYWEAGIKMIIVDKCKIL